MTILGESFREEGGECLCDFRAKHSTWQSALQVLMLVCTIAQNNDILQLECRAEVRGLQVQHSIYRISKTMSTHVRLVILDAVQVQQVGPVIHFENCAAHRLLKDCVVAVSVLFPVDAVEPLEALPLKLPPILAVLLRHRVVRLRVQAAGWLHKYHLGSAFGEQAVDLGSMRRQVDVPAVFQRHVRSH